MMPKAAMRRNALIPKGTPAGVRWEMNNPEITDSAAGIAGQG